MKANPTIDKTLNANIEVHSKLANSGEYNKSPHFRPENQSKVKRILKDLVDVMALESPPKVLDLGCGTGFIISLVKDIADEVHGVDITEDMMKQIDTSSGNIFLKKSVAEETGHPDATFDLVTAYSFLDHLVDYKLVVKEAYRVLKDGGIFYSDLNPNRAFSFMLQEIESNKPAEKKLPHAISREIKGMLHNGEYYEEEFGISKDALEDAEPEKTINKGFDVAEVEAYAKSLGFSKVTVECDWFLGQGGILNSDSKLNIDDIKEYLQMMQPASQRFFKYLRFIFEK
ncbi:MAG: ubiquinone/menaquinone biosynthesis C-methylase UbiE [Phenylobacterium sp.]